MTTTSERPGDPDDARDGTTPDGEIPNSETGVGIGAGEPSTFEPEEDAEVDAEAQDPEAQDDDS